MTRLLPMLLLIAAVAFLVLHLSGGGSGEPWRPGSGAARFEDPPVRSAPIAMTSSEECRACHEDVYREWFESHHRIAYTNPEVQFLSGGFQGEGLDCLPCHLPRPVLETGLGVRVLERAVRHDEGVDCFACHHHPRSRVMVGAGPLGEGAASAPCQPEVHPAISSMDLCAPCHNQHKVHEEWRQSRFGPGNPEERDCNGCHMPEVLRTDAQGRTRRGRSHRYPGAHDPDMLRSAATFEVRKASDRDVLVTIANSGAGHNFPADERHRAVDLHLLASGDAGPRVDVRVFRFRNPYRQDFETVNPLPDLDSVYEDVLPLGAFGPGRVRIARIAPAFNPVREIWFERSTQIPAGESRSIRITLPSGVDEVTLRLWYRLKPTATDGESVLLYEATLRLQ